VHEPDTEVVRAAAAGDERAFERLVRECQVPIRRYLRHLVGDPALAAHDPTTAPEIGLAIASLPANLRDALLLVEICGFSYAEVAGLLGVREGTAKSRVHRAREGIAQWYARPRAGRG
jgi:DNA-directed RNA polymerase specialized sigma24 family protein